MSCICFLTVLICCVRTLPVSANINLIEQDLTDGLVAVIEPDSSTALMVLSDQGQFLVDSLVRNRTVVSSMRIELN